MSSNCPQTFSCEIVRESAVLVIFFSTAGHKSWSGIIIACNPLVCCGWCLILDFVQLHSWAIQGTCQLTGVSLWYHTLSCQKDLLCTDTPLVRCQRNTHHLHRLTTTPPFPPINQKQRETVIVIQCMRFHIQTLFRSGHNAIQDQLTRKRHVVIFSVSLDLQVIF